MANLSVLQRDKLGQRFEDLVGLCEWSYFDGKIRERASKITESPECIKMEVRFGLNEDLVWSFTSNPSEDDESVLQTKVDKALRQADALIEGLRDIYKKERD